MADKALTVTEEKVKAAAASCPDAKRVLEMLFPEVFKDDSTFTLTAATDHKGQPRLNIRVGDREAHLELRDFGTYKDKGLYLGGKPNGYEFKIVTDEFHDQVLTLVKK